MAIDKEVKKNKGNGFKRFLKRLKKILIRLLRKIVRFIDGLYKKFMSLPKYVRQIVYVWTVILVVIVGLVIISNSNRILREEYEGYESLMNDAALDYVKTNELYPIKTNKLKLQYELLKDLEYMYDDDVKDKTCDGFSLVSYDAEKEEYTVNSYIKCKKYVSKDYDLYK